MEFKEVLLDDVVELYIDNRGKTCPVVDKKEAYLPLIATNCITNDLYPVYDKVRYVNKYTYDNWFRGHPQPNDIIFVNKGTPGGTALVPEIVDFCFAQDMVGLRIKKEYDYKYIFALLRSCLVKQRIESMQVGTMIPHFKKGDFKRLKIPVINDKQVQQKIGELHLNILDKIDLNKKIIKNLEQLSFIIFKRWFVDFEFPNEKGEPYKSSGGEMVDSERGLVPLGFVIEPLAESAEFLSGGTPKTTVEEYWNGEIPFFTPKDITGSVYVTQTLKSITELGLAKSNTKIYPKNTIFITARGTVGKLNISNVEMAMNQSCFALRQKQGYQFFLYFTIETLLRQIIQGSNGAVFNAINLKDLNILKIIKPTDKLIADFENIVLPLFNMMSEKENENIALKEMRDTLLPKLLSGEIELLEAMEVTEHVPIP